MSAISQIEWTDATWNPSPGCTAFSEESPRHFARFGADARMSRVGKKAAGRLLDGREWNEMPEAAA